MSGITNRGAKIVLDTFTQAQSTNQYKLALCTATTIPDATTNTLSELTEIAAGNGYIAGGITINAPTSIEDDANNNATVTFPDVTFQATGGTIPASGDGISYAVVVDQNQNVIAWYELGGPYQILDGGKLIIKEMTFTISTV